MSKKEGKQTKMNRLKPLTKREGTYFQELVNTSNRYEAILKQIDQYNFAIGQMIKDRTRVQKGELQGPFQLTVIPKVLSRVVSDKKEILKLFDDQIKTYQTLVKSLRGQLDHRYDEFIESGVRNREFLEFRFGKQHAKEIMPDRRTGKEDEETLFEAEFQKLVDDPDVRDEFHKQSKEAVKKNVARKTKVAKTAE